LAVGRSEIVEDVPRSNKTGDGLAS
jgi:hypothetical protein